MKEEEWSVEILAHFFEGKIVHEADTQKTSFFPRPFSAQEKELLQYFSCMRYFEQIAKLVADWGTGTAFWLRARPAVDELAGFLPLRRWQILLFVFLYLCSSPEGSDIAVADIAAMWAMPEQTLLILTEWQALQRAGLLCCNFTGSGRTFRLPKRVLDAVALVDMTYYLQILKIPLPQNGAKNKAALFAAAALGKKGGNDARMYFSC